jgi:23S rRNA (adenine2503-C2)-methyltransferase
MVTLIDQDQAPAATQGPRNIAGLTLAELADTFARELDLAEKQARMRARQTWRWMHHYGITDFEAMTDIGKGLRARLAERFTIARLETVSRAVSKDGTRKYLFRSQPGIEFESVFIPDVGRAGALCVSSQVGCTLTCSFCHTGTQALVRNLTPAEIAGQLMAVRDDLGEWPSGREDRRLSNIVFMGMGEPLYNLDNVSAAIDILSHGDGLAVSRRRTTVSTSGVVGKLTELGERTGAMLAISLHATRDDVRNELVPLNKKWPIAELLEGIRAYPGLSNAKRVTFEYVMLDGVNDSVAEARELVRLLNGIPAKVNLIPFNPWPGSVYRCSSPERIEAFADVLMRAGYASPVRTPRGRDIFAACGQLKTESVKERASKRRAREAA